jgi:hypothetical protein
VEKKIPSGRVPGQDAFRKKQMITPSKPDDPIWTSHTVTDTVSDDRRIAAGEQGTMFRRKKSILDEIQQGALNERIPLANTLRKCLLLGGMAHSAALREWASRELNGYTAEEHDELPEWRKIYAPLQMDHFAGGGIWTNQAISSFDLPDFARDSITEEVVLYQSVGELESMLRNANGPSVKLGPSGSSEVVTYMNMKIGNPYQRIDRIYWAVSTIAVEGVLGRIRNALVALVAEIRSGMTDDSAVPSTELANQAFNIAVKGKGNRVVINTASDGGVITNNGATEADEEPPSGRRWKRIGALIVGLAGVVGAIAGLGQWLG